MCSFGPGSTAERPKSARHASSLAPPSTSAQRTISSKGVKCSCQDLVVPCCTALGNITMQDPLRLMTRPRHWRG